MGENKARFQQHENLGAKRDTVNVQTYTHTHTKTKNEIPEKIPKNKKQKKTARSAIPETTPPKSRKKNDQMRDARNDTSKN